MQFARVLMVQGYKYAKAITHVKYAQLIVIKLCSKF